MLAATQMRQCSRRFSSSNLFTIFGVFVRLYRVGGSDGVLKGGSERRWNRAPRGQSCRRSRSRYSGDGHAWNSMSDMQFGNLWGGSYFWKGVRKKGGSDEPPEPPWIRACGILTYQPGIIWALLYPSVGLLVQRHSRPIVQIVLKAPKLAHM